MDPNKCKKEIWAQGVTHAWSRPRQCSRKAIMDGYCRQHHPDTVAAQGKARKERWAKESVIEGRKWKRKQDECKAYSILEKMAVCLERGEDINARGGLAKQTIELFKEKK